MPRGPKGERRVAPRAAAGLQRYLGIEGMVSKSIILRQKGAAT